MRAAERRRVLGYAALALFIVAVTAITSSFATTYFDNLGSSRYQPVVVSTTTVTRTMPVTTTSVSTVTVPTVETTTETSTQTETATSTTTPTLTETATTPVAGVSLSTQGLVAYDPLDTGITSDWTFGGSAVTYHAMTDEIENSSGLYLGVESASSGTYAGFYARDSISAELYNAVVSLPTNSTNGTSKFNAGLYVQTGGKYINFIACAGGLEPDGYFWLVEQATYTGGSNVNAQRIIPLWEESGHDQPLSRDCTIVTNGQNFVKVYLDGDLVYSNSSMNLAYQYPLSARMEVQSTDGSMVRYARFSDFYALSSDNVTVSGLRDGATVQLVGASNSVFGSAVAGASGTASLNVACFDLPLTVYIVVREAGDVVATSGVPVQLWGGDTYVATSGGG